MSVIKWKKAIGDWASVYKDIIERRLKKDKNLSDVPDKAAARENLEINGDNVTSHQHDSTYIPMINKEVAERKATDEEILSQLNILKEKEDSSLKDLIQALIDNETAANQKISNLNNQISSTESRLNSNISNATSQANINARTISVPGSSVSSSSMTLGDSSIGSTRTTYNTSSGIGCGTYNLVDVLNALVSASHTHSMTSNCECVCASTTEGPSGGNGGGLGGGK